MTEPITRPAIRYHGAKFRIAAWVLRHFPEHERYVEAFGGAAGVLLQKPRSYAEVYNDLDGDIVNFFRVLQDPEQRARLVEALALTPYARDEFDQAWEQTDEPIERARRTAVRAQMGFGSAGATKGTTGFRIDTRRRYGTAQHLWAEYPEQLVAIGRRFQGVMVENRPALEVIAAHDGPDTLHFVDPPYVHDTRVMRNRTYRHEMDDGAHRQLLDALLGARGMVVVCGYPTEMYDQALAGWRSNTTNARISAGRGAGTRTEKIWINPRCARALERKSGTVDGAWWVDCRWMPSRENLAQTDGHLDDEPDLYRVGKKFAGRLLDGRTWDEVPA